MPKFWVLAKLCQNHIYYHDVDEYGWWAIGVFTSESNCLFHYMLDREESLTSDYYVEAQDQDGSCLYTIDKDILSAWNEVNDNG